MVYTCVINTANKTKFREKLASADWTTIASVNNSTTAYNIGLNLTNIGLNLTRKVPNSLVLPRDFLTGNFSHSFLLYAVSECEIHEAVKSFKPGKAVGYDKYTHEYNQTIY